MHARSAALVDSVHSTDRVNVAEAVAAVPHWRHRIRLPGGIITPGTQDTDAQFDVIDLPADLTGKTVLDVGCSDGAFSFECERRGASRVVGIDNFSSVYIDAPSGFSVAKEALGSKVELIEADFLDLDLPSLGTFDLILFLGILYHLRHPLLGLERLAEICVGQIVVETATAPTLTGWRRWVAGKSVPDRYVRFVGPSGSKDATNWWFPSQGCVEEMLRTTGFCGVKCVSHRWGRAFFHGFTPALGGVADFEAAIPADLVSEARRLTKSPNVPLRSMSIPQFAAVKQTVAELRSKHWSKTERHRK